MNSARERLIHAWREWEVSEENLLPGDEVLRGDCEDQTLYFKSYSEFASSESFWDSKETRVHLGLLPIPYVGCLQRAQMLILLANPGLHVGDYYAEEFNKAYRKSLILNIYQEEQDYPFLFLNPDFHWTPGGEYWTSRLRCLIQYWKDQKSGSWKDATKAVSERIAVVQLVPYHSRGWGLRKSCLNALKSSNLVRSFINDRIDNTGIVVVRSRENWSFSLQDHEPPDLVIYKPSQSRGGSLSCKSPAWPVFQKYLIN